MSLVAGTLRGAWRRAGVSLGILLVATVAAAAAAAGPAYDAAARASILQDNLHDQPPIARTVEVDGSGPVAGLADGLNSRVSSILMGQLGGPATVARLFQPPVEAILAQVTTGNHLTPLTWRTDACAHLRLTAGSCPRGAGQVLVSTSYARLSHVRPGSTIAASGYGRLMVTGEYTVPSGPQLGTAYWLNAECADFIFESPQCLRNPPPWDAMFTPAATFAGAPDSAQGNATVLDVLAPGRVRPGGPAGPQGGGERTAHRPQPPELNASPTSSIPQLTDQIGASWRLLDVPVFLITCQLLLLTWLLLFLIVTEAAEARGGEVALAKLRGHGRLSTVTFGLSEPVLLLAIGLPAGLLAGWAAAAGLARILLRPGTHAGTAGTRDRRRRGRHARRPGGDRTRRPARPGPPGHRAMAAHGPRGGPGLGARRGAAHRGAGRAGRTDPRRGGDVGKVGLAGTARSWATGPRGGRGRLELLPVACGLAFAVTRRRGGTGLFLAVRHIARRPGGTRTTIVLTAAFALATFAIAAFSVDQRNVNRVAGRKRAPRRC